MDEILKEFSIGEKVEPSQYSPLVLAYIGDCVYELFVRIYLIKDGNIPVNRLHKSATAMVKASAQAGLFFKIEQLLSEEETAIFKRGRNTKSHVPKNAELIDYKNATGIEALIGYLYLCGRNERIIELMKHLIV